jgi:hypothetical protein
LSFTIMLFTAAWLGIVDSGAWAMNQAPVAESFMPQFAPMNAAWRKALPRVGRFQDFQ